ncbi:hypothetical protein [Methanobrevibacter curvatus]|uniref:Uncharacterized protein n=1 Tax=Methanobrevibacter curvatus TaxID=49547 RepID=A0A162FGD0_9EURY|nr:hypothetical protein [Methanobrevibacter curvatus]KZX12645.1 hypothetical protein MBCUR_09740 [Methanobrevibacter curvatus]
MASYGGTLIFSHIIPVVFGVISILLIGTGIMEDEREKLLAGIVLFIIGTLIPFIVLPFLVGN